MLCESVRVWKFAYELGLVQLDILDAHAEDLLHEWLNVISNVILVDLLLNEASRLVAIHVCGRHMCADKQVLAVFGEVDQVKGRQGVWLHSEVKSVIKLNWGSVIDNDVDFWG